MSTTWKRGWIRLTKTFLLILPRKEESFSSSQPVLQILGFIFGSSLSDNLSFHRLRQEVLEWHLSFLVHDFLPFLMIWASKLYSIQVNITEKERLFFLWLWISLPVPLFPSIRWTRGLKEEQESRCSIRPLLLWTPVEWQWSLSLSLLTPSLPLSLLHSTKIKKEEEWTTGNRVEKKSRKWKSDQMIQVNASARSLVNCNVSISVSPFLTPSSGISSLFAPSFSFCRSLLFSLFSFTSSEEELFC